MNHKPGQITGSFGEWLSEYLKTKTQPYLVYYDHGDKLKYPNVVAIKGFFGETLSNKNQLAEVDVIVALPNHDLVAIIEIEESESPPKKIIGDIMALLMCNRFCARIDAVTQYFMITPETELIITGFFNPKGKKMEPLEDVILPRLQQLTPLPDGINPEKLRMIFSEDIESTVNERKVFIQELCS
jgi:hypothetical protein